MATRFSTHCGHSRTWIWFLRAAYGYTTQRGLLAIRQRLPSAASVLLTSRFTSISCLHWNGRMEAIKRPVTTNRVITRCGALVNHEAIPLLILRPAMNAGNRTVTPAAVSAVPSPRLAAIRHGLPSLYPRQTPCSSGQSRVKFSIVRRKPEETGPALSRSPSFGRYLRTHCIATDQHAM